MTDISMLVTLKVEAFVVITLVEPLILTTLVEDAECERDGEVVAALAMRLPMTLPKDTIPTTSKQTMMANVFLVLLSLHIEVPPLQNLRRRELAVFGLLV
jgi:hypothetical protein